MPEGAINGSVPVGPWFIMMASAVVAVGGDTTSLLKFHYMRALINGGILGGYAQKGLAVPKKR